MAKTSVEQIKVKGLSKYGFQLESGEYIGWSKSLNDAEKGRVVPGMELSVEMYRADSGKGYVNKVLASATAFAPVASVPSAPKTIEVKKATPVVKTSISESMTKADWANKDRSMMVGGLSHDAAVLAAAAVTSNQSIGVVLDMYKKALGVLIKVREEIK